MAQGGSFRLHPSVSKCLYSPHPHPDYAIQLIFLPQAHRRSSAGPAHPAPAARASPSHLWSGPVQCMCRTKACTWKIETPLKQNPRLAMFVIACSRLCLSLCRVAHCTSPGYTCSHPKSLKCHFHAMFQLSHWLVYRITGKIPRCFRLATVG